MENYGNLNFMEIMKEAEEFTPQYSLEKTVIVDQNKQVGLTFANVKDSKVEKVEAKVGAEDAENYFAITAHLNKVYMVDPITKQKRESEYLQLDTINMANALDAFAVSLRVANAALTTLYTAAMVSPEIIAHKDKLIYTGDFLAALLLSKDNGLDINTYNEIMNGLKTGLNNDSLRSIGLANDGIAKFNAQRQVWRFFDSIRNRVLKNGEAWAKLAAKTLREDASAVDISTVRIQPTGAAPLIKKNADVTPKSLNTQDVGVVKIQPIQ